MTSWLLPDINVWVAMHHQRHDRHATAKAWFGGLSEGMLVFCRQTQLGFFRLMTNSAVMGEETITQRQCWGIFEDWLASGWAMMQNEPPGIEPAFRARTRADEPATKAWTDAYLAAFAETAGLTLVTFDRALAARVSGAVVLG